MVEYMFSFIFPLPISSIDIKLLDDGGIRRCHVLLVVNADDGGIHPCRVLLVVNADDGGIRRCHVLLVVNADDGGIRRCRVLLVDNADDGGIRRCHVLLVVNADDGDIRRSHVLLVSNVDDGAIRRSHVLLVVNADDTFLESTWLQATNIRGSDTIKVSAFYDTLQLCQYCFNTSDNIEEYTFMIHCRSPICFNNTSILLVKDKLFRILPHTNLCSQTPRSSCLAAIP
jgi:hypothetical protein